MTCGTRVSTAASVIVVPMNTPPASSFSATALAVVLGFSALISSADACTGLQFSVGGMPYVAKNHDFMVGDGLLIVNTRGRIKRALDHGDALAWRATYGSVSYNQFGREFPNAGMNEAGLTVEMLWLDEAEFPQPDARPAVGVLQWIQYQLDTASTVDEVLATDGKLRIEDPLGKVHFLLADGTGKTAVVEWLGGKRMVYTGDTLPVSAVANDLYAHCARAWQGKIDPANSDVARMKSYARFRAVAQRARRDVKVIPIAYAFGALDLVKHPDFTQWQTVYEPAARKMTMKRKADSAPIEVDFSKLDFSPEADPLVFDLARSGELKWTRCTPEINERVVRANYKNTPFLASMPDEAIRAIAALPESFSATE